jgi:signal transduction histidine kinase
MTALGLKSRLTLFVVLGAVVGLTVLVAGFNLLLRDSLDSDANRVLDARVSAALEGIDADSGELKAGEAPDAGIPDAQVWIYRGSQATERAPGPPELQHAVDSLAGGPRRFVDQDNTDTRLLAAPVEANGRQTGTVVSALSTEPYEATANKALLVSVVFAATLLVLIALGTQVLVGRALRPVHRMTAEAREWSETDLDHRFNAGDPHDELTELAATFDSMLERLAAALRNEQRFTAEISHELRTPLAAVIAESELALRRERSTEAYREALASISRRANQLEDTLESLLLAASSRSETGQRANVSDAVARAVDGLSDLAGERGISIRQRGATNLEVAANPQTVERAVSPLIENACRYGAGEVELEVARDGADVAIAVGDDGPGLDPADGDSIFEPGTRGHTAEAAGIAGAGLGLSLARRLAQAIGGDVISVPRDGGARFELRIPAAP